jgi:alginate O-acetyltransferase complex protein AlgJ
MTTARFMMAAAMMAAAAAAARAEDPAAGFRDLCAKKAAAGDSMTVAGADGWLFLRSELRHIGAGPFWGPAAAAVSRATSPDKADPLPAIVDFVGQMKGRGIEVLVMPVPCKAVVYPEKLVSPEKPGGPGEPVDPADGRVDQVHRDFFAALAAKGVNVVDLAEVFAAEKAGGELYCKTDTHWSPRACERAARLLATQIGKIPNAKPEAFKTRSENRTVVGDLTEGKGSESLPARVVEAADTSAPADPSPLEDKASPVVVMGDSHCLVFHAGGDLHGTGAGLADQLAAELGRAVDVIGVRGSGATPARVNLLRRAKADPAYLANKKWIVWCFAAREFTESSGWSPVPFGGVASPAR